MTNTVLNTTATIFAPDADRLTGWDVVILMAFHPGECGGTMMLKRGRTTIFVRPDSVGVHRDGEPLTDGVATLTEALDIAAMFERKAA